MRFILECGKLLCFLPQPYYVNFCQCCGSGLFIPDPNNFISRIRIKIFKYFSPKKLFPSSRKYDPGCSSRIQILIFYPSRILGSKRHRIPDPDPQHCFFAHVAELFVCHFFTRDPILDKIRIRFRNDSEGTKPATIILCVRICSVRAELPG